MTHAVESGVYFNEHDPFAAQWLANLWPESTVDSRDIQDVQANDVMGLDRAHFFAGIGGWEVALQLAGWPADRPVWTGSCPCQSVSGAGRRRGEKDERHLWPEFYRLISECRPDTIFGEQTASGDGPEWLDGVSLDLEELGYAVGTMDLPAASVGAPQKRQRLWWVASRQLGDASSTRRDARSPQREECDGTGLAVLGARGGPDRMADATGCDERRIRQCGTSGGPVELPPGGHGPFDWVANSGGAGLEGRPEQPARNQFAAVERSGDVVGMANTNSAELCGLPPTGQQPQHESNGRNGDTVPWANHRIIPRCDPKHGTVHCRISAQSGDEPLVARLPKSLGPSSTKQQRVGLMAAKRNRIGRLRGYGNSIVPQVAAMFIRAFLDATPTTAP